MKSIRDNLIDLEVSIVDNIDHMLYESLFGPASKGINKWTSVKSFITQISPYDEKSINMVSNYAEQLFVEVMKDRFNINVADIDNDTILVVEVGDKNQLEIKVSYARLDWKLRFVPSEVKNATI
jgi:hypothetical protein